MRTLLICHQEDDLDRVALARWLASFSDAFSMIVLRETRARKWRRVRREIERVGKLRFLDVLAGRFYYRLFLARRDARLERELVRKACERYPALAEDTAVLITSSPNLPEAERFVAEFRPDIIVARCKALLKESVFSRAATGTFVMHPGICPEYRNAHGCFWALANGDLERVGMTLLRVDKGVDTGPVYGYYTYAFDERSESHMMITHRAVFENLDRLQEKLMEIHEGRAERIDTRGRKSAAWGQPWLTKYIGWKRAARRRARGR